MSQVHAGNAASRPRAKNTVGSRRSQPGRGAARNGATRKPPAGASSPRQPQARRETHRRPARNQNRTRPDTRSRPLVATLYENIRFGIGRQTHEVIGLLLAVAGVLNALSFFGGAGPGGRWLLGSLRALVGVWVYVLPVLFVGVGGMLLLGRYRDDFRRVLVGAALWFSGALGLFHLIMGGAALAGNGELVQRTGGAIGSLIAFPLQRLLGFWGAFVVVSLMTALGVMVVVRASIRDVILAAGEFSGFAARSLRASWAGMWSVGPERRTAANSGASDKPRWQVDRRPAKPPQRRSVNSPQRRPKVERRPTKAERRPPRPGSDQTPPPAGTASPPGEVVRLPQRPKPPSKRPTATAGVAESPPPSPPPPAEIGNGYQLPPVALLQRGGNEGQSRRMLEETARQLEDTLRHHDVNAKLTNIVPGPTVTRYEIELAPGVKVSRVTNLSGDIAYALATPDVRLLAPIPGRSAIGVEVPNRVRRLVTLGDVLASSEASRMKHPLVVGLGEDISGKPVLLNLAELPHVLIAGATGAGKSSCINSIVTSLLVRTDPEDVRLIMVDPKRVELGQYNGVPHLMTRVITKPKKALEALQWAVAEMDRRYDLLAEAGVRDIVSYRQKLRGGTLQADRFDRFPFLVVLIDELNDLMMVAGRDVESAIVRIAQMARAVGIHLVIATQRPSVNVITGVIKANVPSRLAFSVASQTDSRVIIDTVGAEKLVGMGDMLVVTAREPRAVRVQGAWVSEEEVSVVVDWVKTQKKAEYRRIYEEVAVERRASAEQEDDEDADLVRRATELVVRSQLGSTSMLQRKLRVGFARAGRIMDILEQRGIVGPSEGSKAREVLVTIEELQTPAGLPI